MLRSRANTPALSSGSKARPRLAEAECADAIANAIYRREASGQLTTLRQLHKLADYPQREALRAVAALEELELVVVDENLHDALESTIALSPEMRSRIEEEDRRSAA